MTATKSLPAPGPGQAYGMFTLEHVEHFEVLATASIRRLWPLRRDPLARQSIAGWVRTLRDAKRVRLYRNWI
jgi:hypothetical protein